MTRAVLATLLSIVPVQGATAYACEAWERFTVSCLDQIHGAPWRDCSHASGLWPTACETWQDEHGWWALADCREWVCPAALCAACVRAVAGDGTVGRECQMVTWQ